MIARTAIAKQANHEETNFSVFIFVWDVNDCFRV